MAMNEEAGRAPASSWTKFRCLLWKNYLMQKRHYWHTLFELSVPLLFILMMSFIRSQSSPKQEPVVLYAPIKIDGWSFPHETNNLIYTPANNKFVDALMQDVGRILSLRSESVDDANAVEAKMKTNATFVAGIVFDVRVNESPKKLAYTLRLPFSPYRQWHTNELFPRRAFLEPRPFSIVPFYKSEGFLGIQQAIARAYAQQSNIQFPDILLQALPFPAYVTDVMGTLMDILIPAYFVGGFTYGFMNTVRFMTIEKERQLKEFMQMHGLSKWLNLGSWFARTLIMQLFIIVSILIFYSWPIFGGTAAIFEHSNKLCLLAVLLPYTISNITMGFLVSAVCSKGKTATVIALVVWYATYIPYTTTRDTFDQMGGFVQVLLLFLPNTGAGFAIERIMRLESAGNGLQWWSLFRPAHLYDNISIGTIVLIMLVDVALFSAIAIYIENIFAGTYGVAKPWYYPFQRKYWTRRGPDSITAVEEATVGNGTQKHHDFETEPAERRAGVRIRSLCKKYANKKLAVDNVTLNMYDDQITVLLGHNGAGKSTTIAILSGMTEATRGTALINGYNIQHDTEAARSSMGFCPQHNVLFDEMTVAEHLEFFSLLKGAGAREAHDEVHKYVRLLNLEHKRDALAGTLSGGMKRKLQMGIALCGESRVVLVDEATSGLDPAARRELWDILKNEKKNRTILLTTHFMDEADVLGDRIAILVDGALKCCGSTYFLKKRYGTGYRLICAKDEHCASGQVTALLRRYLPDIHVQTENEQEITYHLPDDHVHIFSTIFADLEVNLASIGLRSFGIALTTMEEIFLRLGKNNPDGGAIGNAFETNALLREDNYFVTGAELWLNQARAMLMKRARYWLRSYKLFVFYNLLIVVMLGLPLFSLDKLFQQDNVPAMPMSMDVYKSPRVIVDESNKNTVVNQYEAFIKATTKASITSLPASSDDLDHKIVALAKDSMQQYLSEYIAGIDVLTDGSILALFNHQMFHSMPLALNLVHNAILGPDIKIDVVNAPVKAPTKSNEFSLDLSGIGFIFGFAAALCVAVIVFSATSIMYYIREKECGVKFLQYVSGVNMLIFWAGSVIWDLLVFLPTVLLIVIMCVISQNDLLATSKFLVPLTLILILFQYANLGFVSLASLIFTKPTAGNAIMSILNIFLVILFATDQFARILNGVLASILIVYPLNTFTGAFINMTTIVVQEQQCILTCKVYNCTLDEMCASNPLCCTSVYDWELGIGQHIVYMIVTGIVLYTLLMLIEMGMFKRFKNMLDCLPWNTPDATQLNSYEAVDDDVVSQRDRLVAMTLNQIKRETVALRSVSKYYGRLVAVKDISFAVKRGECFGLLGNNGAGKTSIFKMLTGEAYISRGDIYLAGYSQRTELHQIFKNIGYCPQFDALLDQLTCRETLEIFSLLRGVPAKDARHHSMNAAQQLDFLEHIDKKVKELSGGNKRKLSTAISLIGNPDIVLLDEPTTGMDPATKRNLWNVVNALRDSGKAIVLTSHSMEECEALCTNLTVMVNGRMKCIGSTQHLKNKFTNGFELKIKVQPEAQYDPRDIKSFVFQEFPGAQLTEEYLGLLSYHVPMTSVQWSRLFGIMERAKSQLRIEDYSINQTSLEQVVLSFVRGQITSEK